MILYHIASITKTVLGACILLITYTSINVYEDPVVGISLGLLGLFVMIRGLSFYIFWAIQKNFRHIGDQDRIMKDSYKLSLLFGIYVMINVGLLLLGSRSKLWGIILLLGFIGLQILLFQQHTLHDTENQHD